jgi:hypothetical protein
LRLILVLLLAGTLGPTLSPRAAEGESALVLPLPDRFGEIAADTFDEQGKRIGDASLTVTRLPDGEVLLEARSHAGASAQTVVTARLRPTEDGEGLRLISQSSRSRDEQGNDLGLLAIDHLGRKASCETPGKEGKLEKVELPARDRVVNVPHNLFFQPLVRGETEELAFQLLVCRTGARLIDVKAKVAGGSENVIEVRYDMQLGPLLSRLAAPFMPRLSVWFDPSENGNWIGQRFPLFSKGPTVIVLRHGFDPQQLGPPD